MVPVLRGQMRGMRQRVRRKLCLPQTPEGWNGQVCLVSQPWAPAALPMTYSSYNSLIVTAFSYGLGCNPGTQPRDL